MTIFLSQKSTKGFENEIIFIMLSGTLLNSNKFHPEKNHYCTMITLSKNTANKSNLTFLQIIEKRL